MGGGLGRHKGRPTKVGAVVATLVMSMVLSGVGAVAQEAPRDLDGLFELFDVKSVAADFVVVVDTSGSMSDGPSPVYPGVLDAYRSLINSIPDGDFVSVITFSDVATLEDFLDPVTPSSRARGREALPEKAEGTATDIGAALDSTLDRLERPDSSDVQIVIFLTDGEHQPPPESKYQAKRGPEWQALRGRSSLVDATHDLTVLGIGLAEGTDIELVRSVFPGTEINNLSANQLAAFFEETVRRSQVARLRTLVNDELASGGVRVSGDTQSELTPVVDSTMKITSTFDKLPVTVLIDEVTAIDGDGTAVQVSLDGESEVTIEPGGSVDVSITLRPEVGSTRFTVPKTTESRRFFVELDARYIVQPARTLGRVTPESLEGEVFGSSTVTTSRTYGWTVTRAVAVALASIVSLLVLVALYRRFIQVPRLGGAFELDGPGVVEGRDILKLKGKRMMLDAANVPGAGSARVKLYSRRGHRGHIYADVERPTFKIVRSRTQERTIPDTTEIRSLATYKMGTCRLRYRDATK